MTMTMGKYRHLSHCSTPAGHFAILALDHRANLLEKLNQVAGYALSDEQFSEFKIMLMEYILPPASGILADPGTAIGKGIAKRIIQAHQGIIAPIEVTDYDLHPSKREMNWIPDWSIAKLKRIGGAGVKMLLPYHPEADNTAYKHQVVQETIETCTKHDIPLFLEPIAYSLDPSKPLPNSELRPIVIGMAKTFSAMGADILKMQFPLDAKQSNDLAEWRSACDELNAACGDVPWALLSAGESYDVFVKQAEIACQAGASGIIAGRAIWSEAVELQDSARVDFLKTIARQRMETLAKICADYAHPWYDRVAMPDDSVTWYEGYAE